MTFRLVFFAIGLFNLQFIIMCHGYVYKSPTTSYTTASKFQTSLQASPTRVYSSYATRLPLSPLPSLPPLSKLNEKTQQPIKQVSQSIFQTHPAPQKSTKLSSPTSVSNFQTHSQSFSQSNLQTPQVQSFGRPFFSTGPSASAFAPSTRYIPTSAVAPPPTAIEASGPIGPSGLTAPSAPGLITSGQPLRIPSTVLNAANVLSSDNALGGLTVTSTGTAAEAISRNDDEFYFHNGRQLKQYAVIEDISNDIEHMVENFLPSTFLDNFRSVHGGTQGVPGPTFQSESGRALQAQQQQQQIMQQPLMQQQLSQQTGGIALGSGGLGYIRLPNGNVYLGSGSLGYISGQERSQNIIEARTRTGAASPDAVHFGHGALGNGFNN